MPKRKSRVVDGLERWMCNTCREWLAAGAFHARRSVPCGIQSECRSCARERERRYYAEHPEKQTARWRKEHERRKRNPEHQRDVARRRRQADPERARALNRAYRERHKAACNEGSRQYRLAHPHRLDAYRDVRAAKANGTITIQPCELCGGTPADAHHDDYDDTLAVRWLCRRCHNRYHHTLPVVEVGEHRNV